MRFGCVAYREDRGDEGISLIEVVIALIILVITLVPLTYVLTSAVSGAANARQQEAAIQLADSWVEILSNSSPPTQPDGSVLTSSWVTPTAPPGTITPKSTLAGTPFIVQSQYSYVSVTGQSDLCTDEEPPSSSHPGVIELQVKVSWASKRQWVTDTTNINYPRPGLQTDGFLAVQVNNSAATDVHGNLPATACRPYAITVSGGSLASPLTLQPDANGCAFAQIPPGDLQPVDRPARKRDVGRLRREPSLRGPEREHLTRLQPPFARDDLRDQRDRDHRHLRRGDHECHLLRRRIGNRRWGHLSRDFFSDLPDDG